MVIKQTDTATMSQAVENIKDNLACLIMMMCLTGGWTDGGMIFYPKKISTALRQNLKQH